MPSLLISYEEKKKDTVLESLSQVKGLIIYDSKVINIIRFYTEVNYNIIAEIEGIISVCEEGVLKDSPQWEAILEELKTNMLEGRYSIS